MQWKSKALSTFWGLAQNNCFQMRLQYLILFLKQLESSLRREGWCCYGKKIRDFVLTQQTAWTIALWFIRQALCTSDPDPADLRWICVFTLKPCLRSYWERVFLKITAAPWTHLLCRMIWDLCYVSKFCSELTHQREGLCGINQTFAKVLWRSRTGNFLQFSFETLSWETVTLLALHRFRARETRSLIWDGAHNILLIFVLNDIIEVINNKLHKAKWLLREKIKSTCLCFIIPSK